MSNSSRPHGLQPTRLLHPWGFPGKSTGVGCHRLLHIPCLGEYFSLFLLVQVNLQLPQPSCYQPENEAQAEDDRLEEWKGPGALRMLSFSCSVVSDSFQPLDCSMPGFPVYHHLLELAQTHVHWVSDAIQPSHSLSSPSPPAFSLSQHQGLFQWVSSSNQVAKVLELQL